MGAGIAGLGAVWLLRERHDVTVCEAGQHPGGHTNTVLAGDRRAGICFGLWVMATKLAFALSVVVFPILEWAGFDTAAVRNDDRALLILALLCGVLPVLVKVGVVAFMWRFPLGRERRQAAGGHRRLPMVCGW